VLQVYKRCRVCGLAFEHDDGFFLGALILNYMVTFGVGITPAIILAARGTLSIRTAILIAVAVTLVLPVILYWHAKSLWMATYYTFVPDDLRTDWRALVSSAKPEPQDESTLTPEEREQAQLAEALAELEGGRPIYRPGGR
jgi:uncharacterized protein (DUF983 family)